VLYPRIPFSLEREGIRHQYPCPHAQAKRAAIAKWRPGQDRGRPGLLGGGPDWDGRFFRAGSPAAKWQPRLPRELRIKTGRSACVRLWTVQGNFGSRNYTSSDTRRHESS